jgi:hypothetical protein
MAKGKPSEKKNKKASGKTSNFPRHSVDKALRIPRAILEQNAGKECTADEAAKFCGINYSGPFGVEISSSIKYGLLERPAPKQLKVTELGRKIIRPHSDTDQLSGIREAVLKAPVISDVYKHYRGENLPDSAFFANALTDTFKVTPEEVSEFISVFLEDLESAKLAEKRDGKTRILDISHDPQTSSSISDSVKESGKQIKVASSDTCFVMMPFAPPLGDHYSKIYEPAIKKTGLTPIRADNEIFGTGKIMDQIWSGLTNAKILIAELTGRNPNVFYELGLAHALNKPVVLVSSNDQDVPFDLRHIRVIYYDVQDPFWGNKLMDKVSENLVSALKNPEEALFKKLIETSK